MGPRICVALTFAALLKLTRDQSGIGLRNLKTARRYMPSRLLNRGARVDHVRLRSPLFLLIGYFLSLLRNSRVGLIQVLSGWKSSWPRVWPMTRNSYVSLNSGINLLVIPQVGRISMRRTVLVVWGLWKCISLARPTLISGRGLLLSASLTALTLSLCLPQKGHIRT